MEPALKQEFTEWFLKVDLVQAQGVNGEWLQSLLSSHVPSVPVPAAVTLNDFLSIVSQAPDPTALLASLKSASERELGEYAAIMEKIEAAKTAANKKRVAFEQKLQKEEDDHYFKHFRVVSKKQIETITKKLKRYPESLRLLSRKALLEAEIALNKSR